MFEATGDASQRTSVVQPFVAYRGKELVGRVVGVVNKKANNTWKTRNVRFSMIEFIDDLEVSKALLDTVEAWGKAQGMDKMQGPMGVTDFDKEGMLVPREGGGLAADTYQHPQGGACEICPCGAVCPGADRAEGDQGLA